MPVSRSWPQTPKCPRQWETADFIIRLHEAENQRLPAVSARLMGLNSFSASMKSHMHPEPFALKS
jgi:hypothetical protein